MAAVYATQPFSVYVTATGETDTLQTGDERQDTDAVAVQLAGTGLFSAVAPSAQTVTGEQAAYLAVDPGGTNDVSGA